MATIDEIEIPSLLFSEEAAPSTPASGFGRLYVKTTGIFFMGDDGLEIGPLGAGGGGASDLQSARYVRTSGDYTMTGAGTNTFANVDGTNLSLTITTGAHRVLIGFVGSGTVDNAAGIIFMDVTVDGTRQGGDAGLIWFNQHATGSERFNLSFTYLTDTLTAASHTFNLQWRQTTTTHTASLMGNGTGGAHLEFYVVEMLA